MAAPLSSHEYKIVYIFLLVSIEGPEPANANYLARIGQIYNQNGVRAQPDFKLIADLIPTCTIRSVIYHSLFPQELSVFVSLD